MAVGQGGEEFEINHFRGLLEPRPGLQPSPQARHAGVEDIREARRVLPGDGVAVLRLPHGVEQGHPRRGVHVRPLHAAQPGGFGQRDRLERQIGIRHRQAGEDMAQPLAQGGVSGHQRGLGQRCGQQQDAKVGVAADRFPRGADSGVQSLPDAQPRPREDGRGRLGAGKELVDGHAVPLGMDVDVAGLQRAQLQMAGGAVGVGDAGGRIGGDRRPINHVPADHAPTRSTKSAARASAMSTALTRCRPCHAGMLLISSTSQRSARSWIRSTPA